jgi:predicted nucleotidyltransferase
MKTLEEIKRILQAQKPYLAEQYGVTAIGVFGSYVRGDH